MAESKSTKSVFEILNAVNVSDKTEKKGKLTYLSWAWAWGEVKKRYPHANYRVFENADGWNYFHDGRTCWVKVGVTIEEEEIVEHLAIMDNANRSIPLERVTSYDVTRSIQRAVTKACARHGLGLYIYAGEDLPEEETKTNAKAQETAPESGKTVCSFCNKEITDYNDRYTAALVIEESMKQLGKPVCMKCWMAKAKAKKEADKNAK